MTNTVNVIDHSDNTGTDEDYATFAEAVDSLEAFATAEGLMTAEGKDGAIVLLDEAGRHTHTAWIEIH